VHEDASTSDIPLLFFPTSIFLRLAQRFVNKPHRPLKVLQQVLIRVVVGVNMQVLQLQICETFLDFWIVVYDGQHVRYARCADEIGLVERVEAADVELAGAWDEVDPTHTCVCGGAVKEVGHVMSVMEDVMMWCVGCGKVIVGVAWEELCRGKSSDNVY
jgi:hypothetical protein